MITPKYPTTLPVKRSEFIPFMSHLYNQISYGGEKYASSDSKEATDIVTEIAGVDWILGTIVKYIKRFQNKQREKDLFKIATYSFIAWLQLGFHKEVKHDEDIAGQEYSEKFTELMIDHVRKQGYLVQDKPINRGIEKPVIATNSFIAEKDLFKSDEPLSPSETFHLDNGFWEPKSSVVEEVTGA